MRWLLVKDLQILRRSPLLVALLIVYPIALALLIGFALSSPPGKPKVAFVNETQPGTTSITLGGQKVDANKYTSQLGTTVDLVKVDTRTEALDMVRSGEALAAVIIPADLFSKLQSELEEGLGKASIEIILNTSDPLERQFVDATIKARLQDLQNTLSKEVLRVATEDLGRVLNGGSINILGQNVDLLGLRNSRDILQQAVSRLPQGSPLRRSLQDVASFANLAIQGLGFASPVLGSIGSPLDVKRTELAGKTTPADAYAIAIAVTVSLMFVALLLAAGMLALEREEHAYGRLVRGLVSRTGLLAEKAVLAATCAGAVTLLMTIGIAIFGSLRFGRFPLWLVALIVAGVAFGALGVAIGALAREVRAASLMAVGLSLPIAFLALVPSSAVSGTLHDVLRVISDVFPFKPALSAVNAALNGAADPSLGISLLHCAILAVAYGALARLAVRRF
jgi:ABC-type multidrug transport system permease subunit